jgi:hypothetical protein
MHADICEPTDNAALARFKRVLHALGAEVVGDYDSSLGVRLLHVRIGNEVLHIFADNWSVDIEGPPALVQQIMSLMKELP